MSKIKDKFKKKWNGLIKIKCASGTPPEIDEKYARMAIDLSSDKEITVKTNKQNNWPDNIYAWPDKKKMVGIKAVCNCSIDSTTAKVTPNKNVTCFILKLKNKSGIGDPDATVTVGEEPPTNGKG